MRVSEQGTSSMPHTRPLSMKPPAASTRFRSFGSSAVWSLVRATARTGGAPDDGIAVPPPSRLPSPLPPPPLLPSLPTLLACVDAATFGGETTQAYARESPRFATYPRGGETRRSMRRATQQQPSFQPAAAAFSSRSLSHCRNAARIASLIAGDSDRPCSCSDRIIKSPYQVRCDAQNSAQLRPPCPSRTAKRAQFTLPSESHTMGISSRCCLRPLVAATAA